MSNIGIPLPHPSFLHTLLLYHTFVYNLKISENFKFSPTKKTLIESLSDSTLESLYKAGNHLTRIANHVRKVMTKPCIKLLLKPASTMESAFPYIIIKKSWQKKSLRLFCQLSYSRQNKCGHQTQLISSVRLFLLRLLLSSALHGDQRLQPSALLLPD